MAFQFRALNKGFSALGTDVNPGPVGMKVLPHGRVIAEHFRTPFVGTGNRSGYLFAAIPFRLDPENTKNLNSQRERLNKEHSFKGL